MDIPEGLEWTLRGVHWAKANAWIAGFPALVAELEKKWQIRVHPPLSGLTCGFVAPVSGCDGSEAILKWLAIDPKGVAGERAYEPSTLMYNPPELFGYGDPRRLLTRRLDLLSVELGIDRERLAAWAFVQAMLSACWAIEDGVLDWQRPVKCAEWLLEA